MRNHSAQPRGGNYRSPRDLHVRLPETTDDRGQRRPGRNDVIHYHQRAFDRRRVSGKPDSPGANSQRTLSRRTALYHRQ